VTEMSYEKESGGFAIFVIIMIIVLAVLSH